MQREIAGSIPNTNDHRFISCPSQETWPNYPILVRRSPHMISNPCEQYSKPCIIHDPVAANAEIELENEYFIGKAFIAIKGLPDSPEHFNGKQRQFEIVVQGRFVRSLPFAKVFTGQAFEMPLEPAPPSWLVSMLRPLITALQPAVQIMLDGQNPYVISPLMSTLQIVQVSLPGNEPLLSKFSDLREDISLHDEEIFTGMNSDSRKRYFSNSENLGKYHFSPDFIYTFDFYQHLVNMATFKIEYGFLNFDLFNILGCRCLQNMAIYWDDDDNDAARDAASSSSSYSSTAVSTGRGTAVAVIQDDHESSLQIIMDGNTDSKISPSDCTSSDRCCKSNDGGTDNPLIEILDGSSVIRSSCQDESSAHRASLSSGAASVDIAATCKGDLAPRDDESNLVVSNIINLSTLEANDASAIEIERSFALMRGVEGGEKEDVILSSHELLLPDSQARIVSADNCEAVDGRDLALQQQKCASSGVTASKWKYIYNIEVWHERGFRL